MSSIQTVLSTEITGLPTWIKTNFKGHYNNALCNGATWILMLWIILHVLYDRLMHGCLRRMGTKQYMSCRFTNSLWYCGFFSAALAYSLVTFNGNKMDLFRGLHLATLNEKLMSTQTVVAYITICTFYLHTALSEGVQNHSVPLFFKYLLLVMVCVSAYILRLLEIPFALTALIAASAISEEVMKICYSLLSQGKFIRSLYVFNLMFFVFIHLIIVPFILLVPLGRMMAANTDHLQILLFLSLILWLGLAIYDSVLSKSILHWIYHAKEKPAQQEEKLDKSTKHQNINCPGNLFECALFSVRTDDAYIFSLFRSQIKARQVEMDARKTPKTNSLKLIQTLKCMMAIKKKLNQKRNPDDFDSDEASETEGGTEEDSLKASETFSGEGQIDMALRSYSEMNALNNKAVGGADDNNSATKDVKIETTYVDESKAKSESCLTQGTVDNKLPTTLN